MTGQSYSDKAYIHAFRDIPPRDRQPFGDVLDAAHDREALGLDASVCARTLIAELRQRFSDEGDRQVSINVDNANAMHYAMDVLDDWVREFGDQS